MHGSDALVGKRVLILAGARGIGRGVASVCVASGANVCVNSRTSVELDATVSDLRQHSRGEVYGISGDIAHAEGAEEVVSAAVGILGGLDTLVWCLGGWDPHRLAGDDDREDESVRGIGAAEVDEIVRFNLLSAFYCIDPALKAMCRSNRGSIVLIGSYRSQLLHPDQVAYAAAKSGLVGLTRSLAADLAPKQITVNCISPGIFPDARTRGPEGAAIMAERARGLVPLGRAGNLSDIGHMVALLAGEAGAYITGQIIGIDGGIGVAAKG